MASFHLRAPNGKIYDPLPSQAEFHADGSKFRWYCGGMGAGKTLAGCVEAFLMAMEYPGSVGMVSRWTHRELMATTWAALKTIVPRALIHSMAESPQKCYMDLRAPEGKISRIWGYGLSNMDSVFSMELAWCYLDEGGQVPANHGKTLWKLLESRLRGPIGPYRAFVTGNPNGRDWLWKLFVGQGLRGYKMFRAPTKQNVHNPDGYEQNLRRGASPEWTRRFLDAEFNEFEGTVLWNWNDSVQSFASFDVPAHYPYFLSIDPGMNDPTAALILTTDERGNVFVLEEFRESNLTIADQCTKILQMVNGRALEWAVIDPSARSRDHAVGKRRIELYRDYGLPVFEGNNNVDDSIVLLQDMCRVDPERENPFTGQMGSPRLFVSRRCPMLRDEFTTWRWGPNGKPLDGDDDLIAALRYGVMRRPHAATPMALLKRRPAADDFWRSIAQEATRELPAIGAGTGGGLGA